MTREGSVIPTVKIWALREIEQGEEITIDYGGVEGGRQKQDIRVRDL